MQTCQFKVVVNAKCYFFYNKHVNLACSVQSNWTEWQWASFFWVPCQHSWLLLLSVCHHRKPLPIVAQLWTPSWAALLISIDTDSTTRPVPSDLSQEPMFHAASVNPVRLGSERRELKQMSITLSTYVHWALYFLQMQSININVQKFSGIMNDWPHVGSKNSYWIISDQFNEKPSFLATASIDAYGHLTNTTNSSCCILTQKLTIQILQIKELVD